MTNRSLAGWVAALGWLGGDAAPAHPLDGPDVDLRISVTPAKVAVQAIFNLAFADELVEPSREDEFAVHQLEEPYLRNGLLRWLREHGHVKVDGVEVTPTLAEFAVDRGDPRWLPLFPTTGAKALIKLRLNLDYKALQAPRTVNVVWQAYPSNLVLSTPEQKAYNEVQALLTAGGTEQVLVLRHDEPEFTWHAPEGGTAVRLLPVPELAPPALWSVPMLSVAWLAAACGLSLALWRRGGTRWLPVPWLIAAGAAAVCWPLARIDVPSPLGASLELPTQEQAAAIFSPLHANVYRAFDYTDPGEVYDALERSVDGSLLDTIYNDVYRSLVMAEEGGAVSRVQAVRPLATQVQQIGALGGTKSFTVDARWQVDGAVFHWGHQHWRTNEHRARYTVVATPAGWRIAGAEPMAQVRISAGEGVRTPGAGKAGGK